jgi:hypothetical protein
MQTINFVRSQAVSAQIAARSTDIRVGRSSRNNQNNKDPARYRHNHAERRAASSVDTSADEFASDQ